MDPTRITKNIHAMTKRRIFGNFEYSIDSFVKLISIKMLHEDTVRVVIDKVTIGHDQNVLLSSFGDFQTRMDEVKILKSIARLPQLYMAMATSISPMAS